MAKGAFITIEGTEGVGKSTSVAFIRKYFESKGQKIVVTREPGGTHLGERIREWVLQSKPGSLAADTEILLMYAARAHHVHKVIRPALASGAWVICDRFTDATDAYQGAGRGTDGKLLQELDEIVLHGLKPDLTLLLDAPLAIGFNRIRNRALDHFEKEDRVFFERVRERYLEIAAAEPQRVKVIDAAQTEEDVQRSLRIALENFAHG